MTRSAAGPARGPFDGEGLPVSLTELIEDGILKTWIADGASARQLGIRRLDMRSRVGSPERGRATSTSSRCSEAAKSCSPHSPKPFSSTELIGQGVNG